MLGVCVVKDLFASEAERACPWASIAHTHRVM